MFLPKIGEFVAYPNVGLCVTTRYSESIVAGLPFKGVEFRALSDLHSPVSIPTNRIAVQNIRPPAQRLELEEALGVMSGAPKVLSNNWAGKARGYEEALASNVPKKFAGVIRDIVGAHRNNGGFKVEAISHSEMLLLEQAQRFLSEELVLAAGILQEEALEHIRKVAETPLNNLKKNELWPQGAVEPASYILSDKEFENYFGVSREAAQNGAALKVLPAAKQIERPSSVSYWRRDVLSVIEMSPNVPAEAEVDKEGEQGMTHSEMVDKLRQDNAMAKIYVEEDPFVPKDGIARKVFELAHEVLSPDEFQIVCMRVLRARNVQMTFLDIAKKTRMEEATVEETFKNAMTRLANMTFGIAGKALINNFVLTNMDPEKQLEEKPDIKQKKKLQKAKPLEFVVSSHLRAIFEKENQYVPAQGHLRLAFNVASQVLDAEEFEVYSKMELRVRKHVQTASVVAQEMGITPGQANKLRDRAAEKTYKKVLEMRDGEPFNSLYRCYMTRAQLRGAQKGVQPDPHSGQDVDGPSPDA